MLIKTFEGFNISDAMKRVKRELGPEAVILSTQEKPVEDGRCKVVEVRAAAPNSYSKASASNPQSVVRLDQEKVHYKIDRLEYKAEKILQSVIDEKPQERLFDQLREIKQLLSVGQDLPRATIQVPPPLEGLFQQLMISGVSHQYLVELKRYLTESRSDQPSGNLLSEEDYRSAAMRWVLRKIAILPFKEPQSGRTDVHLFVGPTGSGKTTCVAKLAALYKKHGAEVCLLSFNKLKIGASDQLKLYSKIIGCEHKTIESVKDLHNELLAQRNAPVVLIDSQGLNPRAAVDVAELSELTQSDIPIDTHLVLSATEKTLLIDRAISYFGSIGLNSLLFTKLDGCWSLGDLFNMSVKWSLPLSFFSTGQKVPDRFELATKERVIENIFAL